MDWLEDKIINIIASKFLHVENKKYPGIHILFEGPEGGGKSTHIQLLKEYLFKVKGIPCELGREPGGVPVSEALRKDVLNSDYEGTLPLTVMFGMLGARVQYFNDKVKPNIEAGSIHLSDRGKLSTHAYQGGAGGVDYRIIELCDRIARQGIPYDLSLVLYKKDMAQALQEARTSKKEEGLGKNGDVMENQPLTFHNKVLESYLKLAKRNPDKIILLETSGSIEENQEKIRKHIDKIINKHYTRTL